MSVAISWLRPLMTNLLPDITTSSETEEDPESENSEPHVESGAMAVVVMVVAAAALFCCKWPLLTESPVLQFSWEPSCFVFLLMPPNCNGFCEEMRLNTSTQL